METRNEKHFLAIPLRGLVLGAAFGLAAVITYETMGEGHVEIGCSPTVNPSLVCHDWECKYIVRDCYTGDGKEVTHYIDNYVRNVDNSISFIADDGLVTEIPYPYYEVIKNPNM